MISFESLFCVERRHGDTSGCGGCCGPAWHGSCKAPYLVAVPSLGEGKLPVTRELRRADLHNKLHSVLTQVLAVAGFPLDVQEKCARSAGDIMANLQGECLDDFPVVDDLQLTGRGHIRVVVCTIL